MPTVIRAIRRVDSGSIKVEVVRSSSSLSTRRPIVGVDASVPKGTRRNSQIDTPAAHDFLVALPYWCEKQTKYRHFGRNSLR